MKPTHCLISAISCLLLCVVDKAFGCTPGSGGSIPVGPYAPYIEELEQDQEVLDKRLDTECVTCESEARRRLIRAQRCAAVICDFEQTNLCSWKTNGSPGAPVPYIEAFLEENPDYALWYASAKIEAENNRPLRQYYMAKAARLRLRHRRKRQSLTDILGRLQGAAGPPVSPAEQAARDALGPVFGEPSAAVAAKAAADLAAGNKIPTEYERLLEKIEADKTWGVYGGEFARQVTGLRKAAQGEKYAVAYLYPAEWSVMSVPINLHDDDYYIRFEGYEHNEDVRLFVACDTPDRQTLSTPIEGTNEGRRQWQTYAAKCPAGTNRLLFVCENVSKTKEGACAIDDLTLFTPTGIDYCQGVDPMSSQPDFGDPVVQDTKTEDLGPVYTPGPYPKGDPLGPRPDPLNWDPNQFQPDLTEIKAAINDKIAGAVSRQILSNQAIEHGTNAIDNAKAD